MRRHIKLDLDRRGSLSACWMTMSALSAASSSTSLSQRPVATHSARAASRVRWTMATSASVLLLHVLDTVASHGAQ